jgi:hypothetical protein
MNQREYLVNGQNVCVDLGGDFSNCTWKKSKAACML